MKSFEMGTSCAHTEQINFTFNGIFWKKIEKINHQKPRRKNFKGKKLEMFVSLKQMFVCFVRLDRMKSFEMGTSSARTEQISHVVLRLCCTTSLLMGRPKLAKLHWQNYTSIYIPLKPLNTIVQWCTGGFRGPLNWAPMMPRDV